MSQFVLIKAWNLLNVQFNFSKIQQLTSVHQFELLNITNRLKNAKKVSIAEEKRFNAELSVWRGKYFLSELFCKKTRSTGGQVAPLQSLTKIRKNNTPLIPILFMPGSCYQNLSGTLAKVLAKRPQNNIQTRGDTITSNLSAICLSAEEQLVSFDFTIFFKMVAVTETKNLVSALIESQDFLPENVSTATFADIIFFLLQIIYF